MLAAMAALAVPVGGFGLNADISLGDCRVTTFAPDWIWQGETVNIMAVARNQGPSETKLSLSAHCPAESEDVFVMPADAVSTVVPPYGRARIAICGIRVSPTARTGIHSLSIGATCCGENAQIVYPISIIRGSLVEKGVWSILLPALVAFLWSAALLIVLPRYAEGGAWKRPSAVFVPVEESHASEASTHERTPD